MIYILYPLSYCLKFYCMKHNSNKNRYTNTFKVKYKSKQFKLQQNKLNPPKKKQG